MKKITLGSIILFIICIVSILIYYYLQQNNNTSVSNPPTNLVTLSLSEVNKHNSASDCYLIINQKIYNVSSFINSHPGGAQKITEKCGQEVSDLFAQIHSNRAWDLLKKYQVGTISSN